MISDNYAIMGLRLFCEYLDAIAYISVGEADTQTLGTLKVTSEAIPELRKAALPFTCRIIMIDHLTGFA